MDGAAGDWEGEVAGASAGAYCAPVTSLRPESLPGHAVRSDAEEESVRILDELLDPPQREDRLPPVDDPMVVRKCHVHHRPDDEFRALRDGPLEDAVHAEDG